VMWGEFGRTPKINNSDGGGRDHWSPAMSALVAGGGLKMGQAIGSSNSRGEYPNDRPYTTLQEVVYALYAFSFLPDARYLAAASHARTSGDGTGSSPAVSAGERSPSCSVSAALRRRT